MPQISKEDRMNSHMNARLTALGRVELVRRVLELGQPASQVAASSGVCVKTVRKCVARRRGVARRAGAVNAPAAPPKTVR